MESSQSMEIIAKMIQESRKSLHRNSFYFILWGMLLIPAGIAEYFLMGTSNYWMIWPFIGVVGGVFSFIYGKKESKRRGVHTAGDRITSYTWGAFGATLVFVIIYSVSKQLTPHPLILITAGLATFISGGISQFKPFVWGGCVFRTWCNSLWISCRTSISWIGVLFKHFTRICASGYSIKKNREWQSLIQFYIKS